MLEDESDIVQSRWTFCGVVWRRRHCRLQRACCTVIRTKKLIVCRPYTEVVRGVRAKAGRRRYTFFFRNQLHGVNVTSVKNRRGGIIICIRIIGNGRNSVLFISIFFFSYYKIQRNACLTRITFLHNYFILHTQLQL